MIIGMYHNRKDPQKVSRAYLYSAIAKMEGIDFFYFTSSKIDFDRKKIKGKHYEDGTWKEKEYNFPDAVINCVNAKSTKEENIKNRLKDLVPFTSYPVGSKLYTYNLINRGKRFRENVIPYKELVKPEDALGFLNLYDKIIIKPVRGHHGDNVIRITKHVGTYLIKDGNQESEVTELGLIDYLQVLKTKNRWVIQKFINCKLKTTEPFDFRLHMQKDATGKWSITTIYPRIGSKKRVVTNVSQGSQIMELDKFLRNEFHEEAEALKTKLNEFALDFTEHFESLYPYQFDELGIDIGLDEDKHIWIYEVNWRPGHVFIEVITAKNAVRYAIYLAKKSKVGKE